MGLRLMNSAVPPGRAIVQEKVSHLRKMRTYKPSVPK
jgi:hypothetical protein